MGSKRSRRQREDLLEGAGPVTTRPRSDHRAGAGAARGAPLSARGLTQLQRTAGNQAVTHLVLQRAGHPLVVQRWDNYPYGSANEIPHIHEYARGAHLKIVAGGTIKRIDLVQNGKRYGDKVAEAFSLARAAGNNELVEAIKGVIRGVPFA